MKKRILSLAAVVVLLTAIFAFTANAYAYYAVYSHCSNGKPLNVRSGPGKEYPVIDRIPYGEAIYVIGESVPGSGWLMLNDYGYVQAACTCNYAPGPYVPPVDPTPDPSPKTDLESVYATARNVNPYLVTLKATQKSNGVANVRWAPSKSSLLLKAYPAGTEVRVLAELNNWYQVQDPITQAVGFVNSAYVVK